MCSLSSIIWNIPNLVKIIKIDQEFLTSLVESGLISEDCVESLQRRFGEDTNRFAFKLLGQVDESGRDATQRLAEVLMSLNYREAVRLLTPTRLSARESDGCFPSKSEVKQEPSVGVPRDLVVKVIPGTKFIQGEDIYKLRDGWRRGLALIVNNENFSDSIQYPTRHGSRRDVQNVSSLFSQMGFDVTTKVDLTRKEMLQTFLDFSSNEKHGDIMVVGESDCTKSPE